MTYGELAENYEFAAIKSTQVFHLFRSMRSLIVFNMLLCFSVFVSNNLIPYAEFKSYNLRKNLQK